MQCSSFNSVHFFQDAIIVIKKVLHHAMRRLDLVYAKKDGEDRQSREILTLMVAIANSVRKIGEAICFSEYNDIISVLCVLKSKIFGQESTYSKDFFKSANELRFIKKCQNRTFKVNFRCQKSNEFFQKKSHLRISIQETMFFIKNIFSRLNF